jgi:Tfp pilus assembly protein PilF
LDLGPHWPWIAIAALAIIPHLGALSNPFAYDDWEIIPENPYMVHPHAIRQMFSSHVWGFIGHGGLTNYYRPLQHLFNYAIFHLFGAHPAWFHFFNIVLHAGVSLAVMAVIFRLSSSRAAGIVAGLLFAVYPVHSEVIAWIACTPDLLSSLFGLLAALAYLKMGRASPMTPARKAALLGLLGLLLLLAMFSKEIGVVLPAILVAYELLVCRRTDVRQWKAVWPQLCVMTAAAVVYLAARFEALGSMVPVHARDVISPAARLYTCLAVFYRYAALVVWPMDLSFFRYYQVSRSPLDPAVAAGALCVAAILVLGVWLHRRRRPEVLGLVIYVLTLLPMFQLPYLSTQQLVTERAAYLPSVGLCWLLACGLLLLGTKVGRRRATVLLLSLLGVFAARSAVRMGDWGDEVAAFQEGLARNPGAFHVHASLGDVLLRHLRPAEAVPELLEAVRLRGDYVDAYNSLGRAYSLLQQPDLALRNYRRAAALSIQQGRLDSAARALANLAVVYRSMGRLEESVDASRRALAADPQFAGAHNNLGYALLLQGRIGEAKRHFQAAIELDPAMDLAWSNLGLAAAIGGEWPSAMACLRRAEQLNPQSGEVQARIGDLYLAHGAAGDARRQFRRALELDPGNQRARSGLRAMGEGQ